jgi:hypothetical protein
VPAKDLCSWHCIIFIGLLKFSMFCGGTVTEFNTKINGIPLHDIPCFNFHYEVQKNLLTCQAPTPHWGIAQPCHCKWGCRKDQGQRLSVLAACSDASTARRKLNSLIDFWPFIPTYASLICNLPCLHDLYFSPNIETVK